MLNIIRYPRDGLRYLRNQRGTETAEWILIVGLLVVVAVAIYAAPSGPLVTGLVQVVKDVVSAISTAIGTAVAS